MCFRVVSLSVKNTGDSIHSRAVFPVQISSMPPCFPETGRFGCTTASATHAFLGMSRDTPVTGDGATDRRQGRRCGMPTTRGHPSSKGMQGDEGAASKFMDKSM
jgi:hypothetical protein